MDHFPWLNTVVLAAASMDRGGSQHAVLWEVPGDVGWDPSRDPKIAERVFCAGWIDHERPIHIIHIYIYIYI